MTEHRADDRAAITEVLARYCHAVDHLDWDELASVYHDDATDRHGAYQGTASGFLEWVKPQFTGRFSATMHSIGNVIVDFDGDRARTQCQVRADHLIKDELGGGIFQFWGSYVDVFARRQGQWRIQHRIVVRRFVNVIPGSLDNGGDFVIAPGSGYVDYTRTTDDPTYWDDERIAAACAPPVTTSPV
jgi:ketosteroid isomerase-like protein